MNLSEYTTRRNVLSNGERRAWYRPLVSQKWTSRVQLRSFAQLKVSSPYEPSGDQPSAIDSISKAIHAGQKYALLKGATGTGKTFVIANVIEKLNKPTMILCHNKTLVSQIARELKMYMPNNSVEMFFSYYDMYRPEAFIESSSTYISKRATIKSEYNALRHRATRSLVERQDVVIVASVSCLYGIGMPERYVKASLNLCLGGTLASTASISNKLEDMLYVKADCMEDMKEGEYFIKGIDENSYSLHITPPYGEELSVDVRSGTVLDISSKNEQMEMLTLYPARHYVSSKEQLEIACKNIERELIHQKAVLSGRGDLVAAERLESIVYNDLSLMRETGHCKGIENYSKHIDGRVSGQPPSTLVDFFNYAYGDEGREWLLVVDESHITLPQVDAMYHGDRARKEKLVKHGFRLPSALDNRPLQSGEFWDRIGKAIFMSATPHDVELRWTEEAAKGVACGSNFAEMIIRPTFCLDPNIEVRSKTNQLQNCLDELQKQLNNNDRTLIITISKRDAEQMTTWLQSKGVKCNYIHSDLNATQRAKVLQALQLGEIDVLVGVNLLREGLDLPEVSLVMLFEADCEGFLRSKTSLIQAVGRAARNLNGRAIFYADRVTDAMRQCIDETIRRRRIQLQYNNDNEVKPASCTNRVLSIFEALDSEIQKEQERIAASRKVNLKSMAPRESKQIESLDTNVQSYDYKMPTSLKLKEEINQLPACSGVYIWKAANGDILYIGKAKNLRSRVKSYLSQSQPQTIRSKRMSVMLSKADHIEHVQTETEAEALVLEAQFIKHFQPLYNILLKDDSRFPYLVITNDNDMLISYDKRYKGKYFGPYATTKSIKQIIFSLDYAFGLSNSRIEAKYGGDEESEKYNLLIEQVVSILEGNIDSMKSHADVVKDLKSSELKEIIGDRQSRCDVAVVELVKNPNNKDRSECMVIISQWYGSYNDSQYRYKAELPSTCRQEDYGQVLQQVLESHYSKVEGKQIPMRILVQHSLPDQSWLNAILLSKTSKSFEISEAKTVEDNWMIGTATKDATFEAEEASRKSDLSGAALEDLKSVLGLDHLKRIEAFDISHLQGSSTTASCVVFLDGHPERRLYRSYPMQLEKGNDDYSSIENALYYRFSTLRDQTEGSIPDLVVIDGGKGQLKAALKGLERAGISDLPICALAKKNEDVYIPEEKIPLDLSKDAPSALLLRAIRDESHRYALQEHRQARISDLKV